MNGSRNNGWRLQCCTHILSKSARRRLASSHEADGYRFFAIKNSFRALEEQIFDSAEKARSAALELYREVDPPLSALTSLAAR